MARAAAYRILVKNMVESRDLKINRGKKRTTFRFDALDVFGLEVQDGEEDGKEDGKVFSVYTI
jgi:hypothetical protein